MVIRRPRVVVAGELAGSRGEFGGAPTRICHLEACVENSSEVAARLLREAMGTITYAAASRAHPSEVRGLAAAESYA